MSPAEMVAAAVAEAGYPFVVINDPGVGRVARWIKRRPPRRLMEKAHAVVGWPATFADDFDETTDLLSLALDQPSSEAWADFVARDAAEIVPFELATSDAADAWFGR